MDAVVVWYVILALFWTSAIIYIIGLAMGIFQYEQTHVEIQFDEEHEEQVTSVQQEQQPVINYDRAEMSNMEAMFEQELSRK